MSAADIPAPWRIFQILQSSAAGRKLDPFGLGHDEALTELPGLFHPSDTGATLPDPERLRRRFDHLRANRATKFRRRAKLDRQIAKRTPSAVTEAVDEVVAVKELTELVHLETSESEWELLRLLADGFTYNEIADRHGTSVESLKSRVSRVRSRIRLSPAGLVIQKALGAY
jgi:DNA-binding CsgD family transcriptional regulator